ncbi:response regulator [Minicystis rosea]|nr:response regulator [Minicystis rosea]
MRMPSSPMPGGSRADSTLDTLLILSRSLAGSRQGNTLLDALDLLLAGVDCARGAAYTAVGDALVLTGERGLPTELRAPLQHLPLRGATWFPAQTAAQTRKLVAAHDLGAGEACPIDREALARARWEQVIACPVAADREIFGVLVLAWPGDEEPPYTALAVLEIACNMIAASMARRASEPHASRADTSDARGARLSGLGILARGFAEDLGTELAEIERRFTEQHRLVDTLRGRLLAREDDVRAQVWARTLRPTAAAEALRPARESTARFLAAIQRSAPERLELAALAADALALATPHLRRLRVDVKLLANGEHYIIGRRSELIQLLVHLVLGRAGVLDDAADICSERHALVPRALVLEVRRRGDRVLVCLGDAADGRLGARASFFELDAEPGGSGVELAVARQIVAAHEGRLELDPGGDRCTVALPAADPRAEGPALGARRPVDRPVLVWIDEDDLFLEIMVQSLPELDIRVARSAAEAMQLLTFGVIPALVLCNVRLPDRSGREIHADLARQAPRIAERFVFIAGGARPEIAFDLGGGLPLLSRPIDLAHVRALAARNPATIDRAAVISSARAGLRIPPRPSIQVRAPRPRPVLRTTDPNAPRTVLVVDDDFDLRQTVRDILQEEGYVVDTAANGREALDRLRRTDPPRVMVLDLMMPVMDGWQLLDELERDDTLPDIPVVVISAGKRLPAANEHACLSKPLDYYKLVTTIDRSMNPRIGA